MAAKIWTTLIRWMETAGRGAARGLMSGLAALALAGVLLPPGLLRASPCCAGREGDPEAGEARPVTAEDVKKFRAAWERMATAAQLSLDELDRSRFDLAALQRALGTDPDAIFTWVREHTRWVPYEGALKGARGVLLARQGNTLDRALLLARLLELAGHSVRIANGAATERRLPDLEAAARASMSGAWRFATDEAKQANDARLAEVAAALGMTVAELEAETAGISREQAKYDEQLAATTDQQMAALRELLAREALPLRDEEATDPVGAALKQHYWVQVLTGENTWRDYDLFFDSGVLPGLVVIRGAPFLSTEVPEELAHKVTFRVVIVVEGEGGNRIERVPLEYEMAPAGAGVSEFQVSLVPLDAPPVPEQVDSALAAEGAERVANQLRKRTDWVPVVRFPGTRDPVSQSGFNASGDLIPSPLAPGQTTAKRVEAGVSLLETLGVERAPATAGNRLVEVRAEVVSLAPGGHRTVERRPIFQSSIPRGEATAEEREPAKLDRAVALEWTAQFLIQTGFVPWEWAESHRCESLLGTNLAFRFLLDGAGPESSDALAGKVATVIEKTDLFSPGLAALAAGRSRVGAAGNHFLGRPNILSLVRSLGRDDGKFLQHDIIDIVANSSESPNDDGGVNSFWETVRFGIADSVMETRAGRSAAERGRRSTSAAFGEGAAGWALVKAADDPELLERDFSSGEVRDAVVADLERGYWVVLGPQAEAGSDSKSAFWWRLHPRNGTTLGMVGHRGKVGGATMTETQIIIRVSIRGAVALGSIYACYQAGGASTGTLLCAVCALAGYLMLGAEIWVFAGSVGSSIASDAISLACAAIAVGTGFSGSGD